MWEGERSFEKVVWGTTLFTTLVGSFVYDTLTVFVGVCCSPADCLHAPCHWKCRLPVVWDFLHKIVPEPQLRILVIAVLAMNALIWRFDGGIACFGDLAVFLQSISYDQPFKRFVAVSSFTCGLESWIRTLSPIPRPFSSFPVTCCLSFHSCFLNASSIESGWWGSVFDLAV